MSTLAIKQGGPHSDEETYHVVLRRHDLSGTEYESLTHVDRTLAIALGDRGVVVRGRDVLAGRGHPGIVLDVGELAEGSLAEIRADIVDPTTVVGSFVIQPGLSSEILGDQVLVSMHWIGVPPSI